VRHSYKLSRCYVRKDVCLCSSVDDANDDALDIHVSVFIVSNTVTDTMSRATSRPTAASDTRAMVCPGTTSATSTVASTGYGYTHATIAGPDRAYFGRPVEARNGSMENGGIAEMETFVMAQSIYTCVCVHLLWGHHAWRGGPRKSLFQRFNTALYHVCIYVLILANVDNPIDETYIHIYRIKKQLISKRRRHPRSQSINISISLQFTIQISIVHYHDGYGTDSNFKCNAQSLFYVHTNISYRKEIDSVGGSSIERSESRMSRDVWSHLPVVLSQDASS
jgi:hypothetical protein